MHPDYGTPLSWRLHLDYWQVFSSMGVQNVLEMSDISKSKANTYRGTGKNGQTHDKRKGESICFVSLPAPLLDSWRRSLSAVA